MRFEDFLGAFIFAKGPRCLKTGDLATALATFRASKMAVTVAAQGIAGFAACNFSATWAMRYRPALRRR